MTSKYILFLLFTLLFCFILYLFILQSNEGLQLLQSLLDSEHFMGKTKRVCYYLNQGTAKRLLSMGLCLPSAAQLITSTNQYLLSLAFEAVHCHVSVLNCLTKNGTLSKNAGIMFVAKCLDLRFFDGEI